MSRITFSHDYSWAYVGGNGRHFAVYPRDDETYSIGKSVGQRTWTDIETGFANMDAAIEHAEWMVEQ